MDTSFPNAPPRQSDLDPELFAWALEVDMIDSVLVIEPSYHVESAPALHFARRVTVPGGTERILSEGHWRVRSWLPWSWGRVARADLDVPAEDS